jgi:hypothetical protein
MLATSAAIWPEPAAAWAMLWVISPVVAVCSSTAAAMVVWIPLTVLMTRLISPIAATASAVDAWIAWISAEMSPVALAGDPRRVLDLAGHRRQPLAVPAGAGRLDGGVQRQQVGLLRVRDGGDHPEDLTDRRSIRPAA